MADLSVSPPCNVAFIIKIKINLKKINNALYFKRQSMHVQDLSWETKYKIKENEASFKLKSIISLMLSPNSFIYF